jgi:hypothetical protein
VAKAAHEVVEEAMTAGVWVFGGGLEHQRAAVVSTDGTVADGARPSGTDRHERVRRVRERDLLGRFSAGRT